MINQPQGLMKQNKECNWSLSNNIDTNGNISLHLSTSVSLTVSLGGVGGVGGVGVGGDRYFLQIFRLLLLWMEHEQEEEGSKDHIATESVAGMKNERRGASRLSVEKDRTILNTVVTNSKLQHTPPGPASHL